MNKIQLKQFGRLASSILLLFALYFMYQERWDFMFTTAALTSVVILLTMFYPKALSPFAKAWLLLGLVLHRIINPIILGALFWGIVTPLALYFKAIGRDELKIKNKLCDTYWEDTEKNSITSGDMTKPY